MAFCIECGAKAPDVAKFCPQCGVSLVEIETVSEAEPAAADVIADETVSETVAAETPKITETEPDDVIAKSAPVEVMAAEAVDAAPSAAASIAAAADVVEDESKSRAGLFVGLGLVALMAAGGGAYAMGLFGSDKDDTRTASAPTATTPTALPETEKVEIDAPNTDPVLAAYKEAIKRGRISDLGQFAKDHPESSLAKDAEDAAFASLNRQKSVLAYNTFIKNFPDADTSSYIGPRENTDEDLSSSVPVATESNALVSSTPSIRTSIAQRADELDPFIAQGDTDYALIIIDEMLALSDLNESEATYLLNLRARAETSRGINVPAQPEMSAPESVEVEFIQPDPPAPAEPIIIQPASAVEITPPPAPEPQPQPEVPAPEQVAPSVAVEPVDPDRAFDTPAKPLERFGAITPDEATEPGSCDMAFSVSTSGTPTNIIASCTDPLFIEPAKETVAEWSYSPALLAGEAVQQNGVVVTIRFNLE